MATSLGSALCKSLNRVRIAERLFLQFILNCYSFDCYELMCLVHDQMIQLLSNISTYKLSACHGYALKA